ncbi:hypothetical protein LTR41_010954 [Exophiala xenobiotica]|nr:hypothetical protein LTR41_010954 [Exophiala xenobiotica]KAK5551122.1 hypothetical protein LTR46_010875 [Exophiala xenobiotica]
MVSRFRVRFAAPKQQDTFAAHVCPVPEPQPPPDPKQRTKSKTGCLECKRRKVKCDEAYPTCRRCQLRGTLCRSIPRLAKWQVEMPWLSWGPLNSPLYGVSNVNQRLLQLWMEKSCQIMVIDPNDNPLSFPVVEHLLKSPSLVHALQSVSAGYEAFFDPRNLTVCLEERQRALVSLQDELNLATRPLPSTFLTIFMLGMTTSWVEADRSVFGKEHLCGARAIIDSMVEQHVVTNDSPTSHPVANFIVGSYIYWDMCCAPFADPDEIKPLNTPEMYQYTQSMRHEYHPIGGFSIELWYMLGNLGRHCRKAVEGLERDLVLEATFEEQLLQYTGPEDNHLLAVTNDCFRNHGLILLYRICGIPASSCRSVDGDDEDFSPADTDETIRALALEIVSKVSEIPLSSPNMNILALPLLSAGSELNPDDHEERKEVLSRLLSLYSRNRCPPNLWACNLLKDVWGYRDEMNSKMSWLALALLKGWKISQA